MENTLRRMRRVFSNTSEPCLCHWHCNIRKNKCFHQYHHILWSKSIYYIKSDGIDQFHHFLWSKINLLHKIWWNWTIPSLFIFSFYTLPCIGEYMVGCRTLLFFGYKARSINLSTSAFYRTRIIDGISLHYRMLVLLCKGCFGQYLEGHTGLE